MYALYSKSFAKGAVDLNKRDFYDGFSKKLTSKGKVDGVEFEVNISDKPNAKAQNALDDADATVTVPVDDSFSVAFKAKACKAQPDVTVTGKLKVSDALSAEISAKNFDTDFAKTEVSGAFTYLDPAFSVEGKFGAFDGPKGFNNPDKKYNMASGTLGLSAAIAMDCPFAEGVTVGVQPSFGYGSYKKEDSSSANALVFNMPFAVGGGNKDFQLAFVGGLAMNPGAKPAISSGGLKGLYNINSDLQVAFEVDQQYYKMERELYKAGKVLEEFNFKVGTQYKVSDSVTAKAKYTLNGESKSIVDVAATQKFSGKCSATLSCKFDAAEDKPSIGLTYNLEA